MDASLYVSFSELTLPSIVLAFDRFPFALPIQNEFRMDRALQFHERHVLKISFSYFLRHEWQFIPRLKIVGFFAVPFL
jgi:hypothetical protein